MVSCICGHCRRVVDYGEGVYDDMVWYHERCYFIRLKGEVEGLEKKFMRKTITLDEAEHLNDIRPILENLRTSMREPKIQLAQVLGAPRTPVFDGASEGMKRVKEHNMMLEEHTKKPARIATREGTKLIL